MRKVLQHASMLSSPSAGPDWIDLLSLATAELSSEDPAFPFENALEPEATRGFRAGMPGLQSIRLTFDHPRPIRKIRLEFEEETTSRSQEFTLAVTHADGSRREIIRQQWSFSPGGSTTEVEEYTVQLDNVLSFELIVDPGRHDKNVFVTLQTLRIA
jgi:hypothetical protein